MPRRPQPGIVQFALDVPLDAKMRFESLHATLGFKNKSQTFQAILYAVSTQDKIDPAALGRIEAGVQETLRLLESFMQGNPDLVQYVKDLPREQLERKFLLRKMKDEEQKEGYTAKVKSWLQKPEQADLVQSIKSTISPNMQPQRQEQALVAAAKNHIRNNGIKLG